MDIFAPFMLDGSFRVVIGTFDPTGRRDLCADKEPQEASTIGKASCHDLRS